MSGIGCLVVDPKIDHIAIPSSDRRAAPPPAAAMAADGALAAHTARLPKPARLRGAGGSASYSLAAVAEHNTPSDCWLIIRGRVYDVTPWCAARPTRRAPWRARARAATRQPGCRHVHA
jgi:hypothetical protein